MSLEENSIDIDLAAASEASSESMTPTREVAPELPALAYVEYTVAEVANSIAAGESTAKDLSEINELERSLKKQQETIDIVSGHEGTEHTDPTVPYNEAAIIEEGLHQRALKDEAAMIKAGLAERERKIAEQGYSVEVPSDPHFEVAVENAAPVMATSREKGSLATQTINGIDSAARAVLPAAAGGWADRTQAKIEDGVKNIASRIGKFFKSGDKRTPTVSAVAPVIKTPPKVSAQPTTPRPVASSVTPRINQVESALVTPAVTPEHAVPSSMMFAKSWDDIGAITDAAPELVERLGGGYSTEGWQKNSEMKVSSVKIKGLMRQMKEVIAQVSSDKLPLDNALKRIKEVTQGQSLPREMQAGLNRVAEMEYRRQFPGWQDWGK